jgi:hypothetical protein
VLTTGGLLLFSSSFPLDLSLFTGIVNLINDSKNLAASLTIDSLRVNYLYDAILGLVYVIAWRKEIDLDFPDKLLKAMSLEWKGTYDSIEWKGIPQHMQINSSSPHPISGRFTRGPSRLGRIMWSKRKEPARRWPLLRAGTKNKRRRIRQKRLTKNLRKKRHPKNDLLLLSPRTPLPLKLAVLPLQRPSLPLPVLTMINGIAFRHVNDSYASSRRRRGREEASLPRKKRSNRRTGAANGRANIPRKICRT